MKKKVPLIVGLALLLLSTVLITGCRSNDDEILNMIISGHKNLGLHIHPFLEIKIHGENQIIPGSIGISGKGLRVIHTHDSTGKIHIEAPFVHQFYLKDFFTIWERQFNSSCIFYNCIDENNELLIFVNGLENDMYENLPLKDNDRILIVYTKKE